MVSKCYKTTIYPEKENKSVDSFDDAKDSGQEVFEMKISINPNDNLLTGFIDWNGNALITGFYCPSTLTFELRITHQTGKVSIIDGRFLNCDFTEAEGILKSLVRGKTIDSGKRISINEIVL